MSKEYLLEQISLKASSEADEIVLSAEKSAAARKQKLTSELEAEYEAKLSKVNEEAENIVSGQLTLSRIDARKAELKVRRELIDNVYKLVRDRLTMLDDKEYKKFIAGLIAKFAENGDEVIICACDEARITKDWLSDIAFDLQLDLTLSKERHFDEGGIILRGKKYDKNLTVTAIVDEARKSTEKSVADRLFG